MTIEKNLVQRALAGIVFLAVMVFCIMYNRMTLAVLFSVIAALASYEMVQLVAEKTGVKQYRWSIVAALTLIPVAVLLPLFFPTLKDWNFYYACLLIPFLGTVVLFLLKGNMENRLARPGIFIFSIFYIVTPFLMMIQLAPRSGDQHIYFPVLYLFILVWTNDTMAYVCGRLFGKHKLAPEISPKKTWEGFIGGIVFTVIASFIIHYCREQPLDDIRVWLLPLVVSVFGTIGDLFESAIKRWAGVKDSGNLIPGHGGILDRFDGAIFAVWPYFFIV